MPQLMPLCWLMYMFVFFILIFMMKIFYSLYILEDLRVGQSEIKSTKNLWFW